MSKPEISVFRIQEVKEVRKAVSSMKQGKAPGDGCMSAHILKTCEEIIVRNLLHIFEGIRDCQIVEERRLAKFSV